MEYSWFLSSLMTVGSMSVSAGEVEDRCSARTWARAGSDDETSRSREGCLVSDGSASSIPYRRTGRYCAHKGFNERCKGLFENE